MVAEKMLMVILFLPLIAGIGGCLLSMSHKKELTKFLTLSVVGFLPFIAGVSGGSLVNGSHNNKALVNFLTVGSAIIISSFSIILFCWMAIDPTLSFLNVSEEVGSKVLLIKPWFSSGNLDISFNLRVDALTISMLLIVTLVSLIVHIYSTGYMKSDKNLGKFMSYLALFTFFMIVLVSAGNILQLFIGWEGVGLCSYLLIGFWYQKRSACQASMKAFIVNRVADFAFIFGIIQFYYLFGSFDFGVLNADNVLLVQSGMKYFNVLGYQISVIDVISLLFMLAAMGKSAQILFHVWLPDAMEGPTPVSALIHAATMVTAGIFLLSRMSPILEYSTIALNLIILIGATTAIMAALIALVQNDIKKVIAYSTCSQLGYMFFACGLSVYSAAIFHLGTHAFFKALLFLCAGNIIYSLHHEQDIRKMGGLFRKIPYTHILFVIGSIAISGLPPFAGFYSKHVIIESTLVSDLYFANYAYIAGVLVAFLTSLYSMKLLILVFYGEYRGDQISYDKIQEAPLKSMVSPLVILAIGAIFSGYLGYQLLGIVDSHSDFWQKSIFVKGDNLLDKIHGIQGFTKYLPTLLSVLGVCVAIFLYALFPFLRSKLEGRLKIFYILLENKFYFDIIYRALFVMPLRSFGNFCYRVVDVHLINRYSVDGWAVGVCKISQKGRVLYKGMLYDYIVIAMLTLMTFTILLLGNFF